MNILVTGANGQLGSEIKLLASSFAIHNFFFTTSADLDITDAAAVATFFTAKHIQLCVNCAAYTAVDKAESEKDAAYNVNAAAAGILAKACAVNGAKLIHVSTDFVFDGNLARPLVEADVTNPLSVYGSTKLEGEKQIQQHLPSAIILRTAWVYSTFGNNFVKTMLRLCKEKPQLNIIYDQIGTPTYAGDLAAAILHIASNEKHLAQQGVFHFTNEGVCSWYDFAIAVRDIAGLHTPIFPIETYQYPTPAARPKFSVLNKKLFKETFAYEIPYWRTSLEQCVKQLC
ncbi:MAG: dTDP-4-dehydrorhamnose reductase [Chitinophagales bacterium]|nr:dTDP-4-dehydrorhamnose reductase [Chitinophagales bacterium]